VACLEDDFDRKKAFSKSFKVDVAGFTDTIQIQRKDQKQFHEFTVKTEMSRACADEDIYTKVTTISPCYVLHNKTSKTIMIK
jgi:SHR-binding domain of vacuolar-sorting associated protein 13